jgi:hypothetical protein
LNGSINGMFYYSKKVTKKKKAITDIFKWYVHKFS